MEEDAPAWDWPSHDAVQGSWSAAIGAIASFDAISLWFRCMELGSRAAAATGEPPQWLAPQHRCALPSKLTTRQGFMHTILRA